MGTFVICAVLKYKFSLSRILLQNNGTTTFLAPSIPNMTRGETTHHDRIHSA